MIGDWIPDHPASLWGSSLEKPRNFKLPKPFFHGEIFSYKKKSGQNRIPLIKRINLLRFARNCTNPGIESLLVFVNINIVDNGSMKRWWARDPPRANKCYKYPNLKYSLMYVCMYIGIGWKPGRNVNFDKMRHFLQISMLLLWLINLNIRGL